MTGLNMFDSTRFRIRRRMLTRAAFVCLLLCGSGLDAPAQVSNALLRIANTTLQMPQAPQGFGFTMQNAFSMIFSAPIALRTPPGETNRLFVVEQGGKIWVITNLAAPNKTLFLDLSRKVLSPDTGITTIAFHPGYATNGFFFLSYSLKTQTAAGNGSHYRVARFSVSLDNPNLAATNELPLITQYYGSGAALTDDMTFGSDGFLYISVVDPYADPSGNTNTSQRIDRDLFGGVLRLDVDQHPDSLLPNPHPAVSINYAIPADNPFIGATQFNGASVDPTKVRTEFYAIGLRNPWRMFFDPPTGLLYVGDPGASTYDEIDVISRGGNYGWPFREGTVPGPQGSKTPSGFSSINPIYQLHAPAAIIGGVVYRGQRLPELQDAFIFGDWLNGGIRAVHYAGTNLVPALSLVSETGIVAFGFDPSNGDVLAANHENGVIRRLVHNTVPLGSPLPPTLADTGVFADPSTLTVNAGIVPYDLNVPFWSDNAIKSRWFSVPNLTATIGFSREGNWSFPAGTVWIKHFELELTNGVPESAHRLETRLLVRNVTGLYGVTYRWGDSRTNADLVQAEGLDEDFTIYDSGFVRTQTWHYPSRSECLTCHTPVAGHALGFNTAQLNRDFHYANGTQNQLRALSEAGYLGTNISGFHTMPALAHPTNAAISLDFRVRSYLAANCVQCHQPGGAALGHFDARLTTPLSASGLMNGQLVDALGDSENRVIKPGSLEHSVLLSRIANPGAHHMPPLATSVLNQQAIDLVRAWITGSATNFQTYADWQLSWFGSTNAPGSAPGEDADGDGASNGLEYLTGTNPRLASDYWSLGISMAGTQPQLSFPGFANRSFQVQWTTNLANPGSWIPLDVPGNEPLFSITNFQRRVMDPTPNAPSTFYRVQVKEP